MNVTSNLTQDKSAERQKASFSKESVKNADI